jgi:hypothetical protein
MPEPEHNHGIDHNVGTPEERTRRFAISGGLRVASALLQTWGGVTGGEGALVVEAAEEFADAGAFVGAAVEAKTEQKGISQRWRNRTVAFAGAAATIATLEAGHEIVSEMADWSERLGGLNVGSHVHQAALGALALNSVVFGINRKGNKSPKASDRFAFRDGLRDFVIPGGVLAIAAVKAPHLAEFVLEGGGVAYGWNNVRKLWKDWRGEKNVKQNGSKIIDLPTNNVEAVKPEPPEAA